MSWKVAHACVRGSAHVRSGLPNQDAVQCTVTPAGAPAPAIAVVAVSDGHGGARHFRSEIGSSLAVSTAVDVVQNFLSSCIGEDESLALDSTRFQDLQRRLVDNWLAAVSSDLENHPLSEDELLRVEHDDGSDGRTAVETLPVLAYGATLLLTAATDSLILYLQLGDGEILSVAASGHTSRPLPPDERLLGNQTTSLCQPEAWQEFRSAWFTASDLPALVLLSTDGYVNSFRSDEDFLKIGGDYLEIIREQGISTIAEELPEILKEASEQGSGDDITLAILKSELRKNAAEANGAPVRPKMSPESRSALIEQLKARHSSQHRKLNELSSRLEQSRKHNRRLQMMILVLILAMVAAGFYLFRGKFVHAPSAPAPELKPAGPPPQDKSNAESAGSSAPSARARPARPTLWLFRIAGQKSIPLYKRAKIFYRQIIRNEKEESRTLFAEVAWDYDKRQMQLINRSGVEWTVTSQDDRRIKPNGHLELGWEPEDITFVDGVSGTIIPVVKKAPRPAVVPNASGDPPGREK